MTSMLMARSVGTIQKRESGDLLVGATLALPASANDGG
jgi:hypothetical protein